MSADTKAVIDAWRAMADRTGLPQIKLWTDARSTQLKARIAQVGTASMLEAIAKVEASDHCRGQNNRGWVATIDFLLQPSSLVKTLEGNYDNRRPALRNGAAELLARDWMAPPVIDAPAVDMIKGPAA